MWKITPAEGLKVRDPKHLRKAPIPAEGIVVKEITTYWHRRIECKDVFAKEIKPQESEGAQ